MADSASDSDILKDSEIYDGVFRNTMSDDELPDWIKNHVSIVSVFYRPGSYGSGFTEDIGNATAPWNANGSSGGANSGEGENGSGISGNGSNPNSDAVLGSDHDTAPGIGGDAFQALALLVLVIVEAVQLIQMPMRLMSMTMLLLSLQITSNWELFALLPCYC